MNSSFVAGTAYAAPGPQVTAVPAKSGNLPGNIYSAFGMVGNGSLSAQLKRIRRILFSAASRMSGFLSAVSKSCRYAWGRFWEWMLQDGVLKFFKQGLKSWQICEGFPY
ncbi:MAG: hypothetical protein OSJ58_03910 [Dysosmobacter sp.]|nr:hypothetical protein [Dysosmobacter sp.]